MTSITSIMSIRSILTLVSVLPFGILLAGCPHHVSDIIDETLPPEDYEPNYLSSTISFEELVDADRGSTGYHPTGEPVLDTLGTVEGTGAIRGTRYGPIAMDLRSVDDSRYPKQIVLQAYVFDTAGRYVSGLAPPNLTEGWQRYWPELIDSCGGVATKVEEFRVEEVSEETRTPYALAIALDHSGSMGAYRVRVLRRAVGLFLKGISSQDNVSVISFTDAARREVKLTGSKKEWVTGFDVEDMRSYGGGTNLYDAAIKSIGELDGAPKGSRKVLILFTDGGDFGSRATLEQAYRHARNNGVTIYTIAYGPADREVLSNLAEYTGGRMYRIYSSSEFLPVFLDLYRRLTRFYRITYTPPECASIHTVRASLSLPELGIARLFGEGTYDRSVLTPFDTVGSIAFVAIEFDYDRATIHSESESKVDEVVDILKRYPGMRLEIRGHTDDRGEEEYNQDLSERRAQAVADRITAAGIDRRRLQVRGFGESRPLVPNDSEENRKKNRRTEFVVISR